MKVAVQTRPWGPEANRMRLAQVLEEVRSAGYDGIEIGAQHVDISRPDIYRALLASKGLQPAAIHVGGEIYDPESVRRAMENLERTVAFAAAAGAQYLAFSGKPKEGKDEHDFRHEAESLDRVGALCQAQGLVLAYHNHYWEIEGDCRELRYLCDHTDPALVSLCLDVAWVLRGGQRPDEVVREFLPRIAYLHLKDTRGDEWKELGQGDLDFEALFSAALGKQFAWHVVEQDVTAGPAAESARLSRQYLKERWSI